MTTKSVLKLLALALALAGGPSVLLAQDRVQPPARPPGTSMIRVAPGMNPQEVDRQVRAHHHKMHVGKDVTREAGVTSDPGVPVQTATSGPDTVAPVVSAHFGNADAVPARKTSRKTAARTASADSPKSGKSSSTQIKSGS
jgi:hypothetical protein